MPSCVKRLLWRWLEWLQKLRHALRHSVSVSFWATQHSAQGTWGLCHQRYSSWDAVWGTPVSHSIWIITSRYVLNEVSPFSILCLKLQIQKWVVLVNQNVTHVQLNVSSSLIQTVLSCWLPRCVKWQPRQPLYSHHTASLGDLLGRYCHSSTQPHSTLQLCSKAFLSPPRLASTWSQNLHLAYYLIININQVMLDQC